jgi:hypothetical protein
LEWSSRPVCPRRQSRRACRADRSGCWRPARSLPDTNVQIKINISLRFFLYNFS